MLIKGLRIDIIIINKARFIIRAHFSLIVLIKSIDLLANRDLIFELEQLNALTLFVNIIDYSLSRIVIRNETNLSITLDRYIRLNKVLKYKAEDCFQIDSNNVSLIEKSSKKFRFKFLIKKALKGLLYIIIVFQTIISS